ncbi:MAG: M1 family metallopeptidase [Chitinophagaceae bacterium]
MTPERAWWDVQYYSISVQPFYTEKKIKGSNTITFKVLKPGQLMQIDLQQPMNLDVATWNKQTLKTSRDGNVYYINFPKSLPAGSTQELTLQFSGGPRVAVNPPWDGGWIFTKDKEGRPWMSVACQGLGASVWYPCKDYQGDEPDKGASLAITVPDTLLAVGNGRLKSSKKNNDGTATYTWNVVNPINNYNLIPYIGKYIHWHKDFPGLKGKLDCDYYVLDYNEEKAKSQFTQADTMLKCFEYWYGPYPFYEDGYKLIEAPHLGMEHQSAVAYGNGFQNGYRGRDLSGTGWGKKWDFIIVHESGHEWFANSITSNDIADMWIHEGFTNYCETLFTTCQFGVEAGNDYVIGTRKLIRNDIPIIGHYGVNQEGSGDMYYKGGNMLHTIRQVVGDSTFHQLLLGLNKTYYHKTVDTKDVENLMSQLSGKDLSKIFDQYLRTVQIPELEYKTEGSQLQYRWTNCVKGFNMPVKVAAGSTEQWITPTEEWQSLSNASGELKADRNFYITVKKS